jgi:hypothetical protein
MAVDENTSSSTGNQQDNLETIIGIGPKTAAALSRIGIHRLEELAESTPDGLAKALADGADLRISPRRIEAMNWIGQAKQKLAERNKDASGSPRAETTAMPNAQASGNQLDALNDLQAEFTLYFESKGPGQDEKTWQTRVIQTRLRDQDLEKEMIFVGTEPHPWVNWILQQADLPVEVESGLIAPETLISPTTVTPNPAQVTILDVQIEPQSSSDVRSGKFVSAIHFTVSGIDAETLAADNTPYQIIIHAVDFGSGVTKLVASERSQLQTGQSEYIHRLEQPIPDLRRYELQTIVLIQSQPELMSIYRGPTINVTP